MKFALRFLIAVAAAGALTGCYCCQQQYDPCNGLTYQYKQFGVSCKKEGCVTCKNGCETGCQTGCSHGGGYGGGYGPAWGPSYGGDSCPCDSHGPHHMSSGPVPEWQPSPQPAPAAVEQTGFRPTQRAF